MDIYSVDLVAAKDFGYASASDKKLHYGVQPMAQFTISPIIQIVMVIQWPQSNLTRLPEGHRRVDRPLFSHLTLFNVPIRECGLSGRPLCTVVYQRVIDS